MFIRPLHSTKARTRGPIHPFNSVRGVASSTRSNETSDEAEDSDEAENFEDDTIKKELEDNEHSILQSGDPGRNLDVQTSNEDSTLSGTPGLPRILLPDFGQSDDGSHEIFGSNGRPVDQKLLEEVEEEYSSLLSKLTISRDQTEASNFDKERLLAIASEISRKHFLPEQISPATPLPNFALQDYELQLMLLEQQNKKRLLMARQEQDKLTPGFSDMPHSGKSHLGRSIDTSLDSKSYSDLQQSPMHLQQVKQNFPTEKPAQAHTKNSDSELVGRLLRRIEELEQGIRKSESLSGQGIRSSRFQILHMLDDANNTPTWTFGKAARLQLKAELPLVDLDTHLRKNDDISFLVYKSYATPRFSITELAESLETGVLPAPEPVQEFIQIMSEELRVALELFLRSTQSVDKEDIRYSLERIEAPYLFWYRARSDSKAFSLLPAKPQAQLKLLVDWIEQNYAAKYDQFDEMTSRGRISHAFTEYLFCPNDVVVQQDGEKTKAYRLHGVPGLQRVPGRVHHSQAFEKLSRAESRTIKGAHANEAWNWQLSCWTIVYDGQFYRRSATLTLKLIAERHDEEIDINELTVIPLRFVGKELRERLMQRGRTFWSCRIKRPVSYRGDEDASHTVRYDA
jgi:hypothetical protein